MLPELQEHKAYLKVHAPEDKQNKRERGREEKTPAVLSAGRHQATSSAENAGDNVNPSVMTGKQ